MPTAEYPWQIPLRRSDGSIRAWVLVDRDDYFRFAGSAWCETNGYAVHRRDGRVSRMHREILGLRPGDGLEVDHINRDRSDNRRANLRIANRRLNGQNLPAQKDSTSAYRGVCRAWGYWRAQAGKRNAAGIEINHHLGLFELEIDAAATAAQWRHENLPGAIEDPELLAHKCVSAVTQRILTPAEVFSARLIAATTSLSHRKIADLLGSPHPHAFFAAIKGDTYADIPFP